MVVEGDEDEWGVEEAPAKILAQKIIVEAKAYGPSACSSRLAELALTVKKMDILGNTLPSLLLDARLVLVERLNHICKTMNALELAKALWGAGNLKASISSMVEDAAVAIILPALRASALHASEVTTIAEAFSSVHPPLNKVLIEALMEKCERISNSFSPADVSRLFLALYRMSQIPSQNLVKDWWHLPPMAWGTDGVPSIMWAVAAAGMPLPYETLVIAWTNKIINDMGVLAAVDISRVLFALAELNVLAEPFLRDTLMQRTFEVADNFDARDLSMVCWALGKMQIEIKLLDLKVLDRLQRRAFKIVDNFTSQEIAKMLWAFARLNVRPSSTLMTKLTERVYHTTGEHDMQAIVQIPWAFSILKWGPDKRTADALLERSKQFIKHLPPITLADFLTSIAQIHIVPSRAFIDVVSKQVVMTALHWEPKNIADLMQAFARMQVNPGVELVSMMTAQCFYKMDHMTVSDICTFLSAMAQLKLCPAVELVTTWRIKIINSRFNLEPREIASIFACMSDLKFAHDKELLDMLHTRTFQLGYLSFSPGEVGLTLKAVVALGLEEPQLCNLLGRRCMERNMEDFEDIALLDVFVAVSSVAMDEQLRTAISVLCMQQATSQMNHFGVRTVLQFLLASTGKESGDSRLFLSNLTRRIAALSSELTVEEVALMLEGCCAHHHKNTSSQDTFSSTFRPAFKALSHRALELITSIDGTVAARFIKAFADLRMSDAAKQFMKALKKNRHAVLTNESCCMIVYATIMQACKTLGLEPQCIVMEHLEAIVMSSISTFTPAQITCALHSLVSMDLANSNLFAAVIKRATAIAGDFQGAEAASLLDALPHFAGTLQPLLPLTLVNKMQQEMSHLMPQHLAMGLAGLIQIGYDPGLACLKAISNRVLELIVVGGAPPFIPDPLCVSTVLWAYASFGEVPDAHFVHQLTRHALPTFSEFSPADIERVLWSLASLGITIPTELLGILSLQAEHKKNLFTPKQAANTLWALNLFGVGGQAAVVSGLRALACTRMQERFFEQAGRTVPVSESIECLRRLAQPSVYASSHKMSRSAWLPEDILNGLVNCPNILDPTPLRINFENPRIVQSCGMHAERFCVLCKRACFHEACPSCGGAQRLPALVKQVSAVMAGTEIRWATILQVVRGQDGGKLPDVLCEIEIGAKLMGYWRYGAAAQVAGALQGDPLDRACHGGTLGCDCGAELRQRVLRAREAGDHESEKIFLQILQRAALLGTCKAVAMSKLLSYQKATPALSLPAVSESQVHGVVSSLQQALGRDGGADGGVPKESVSDSRMSMAAFLCDPKGEDQGDEETGWGQEARQRRDVLDPDSDEEKMQKGKANQSLPSNLAFSSGSLSGRYSYLDNEALSTLSSKLSRGSSPASASTAKAGSTAKRTKKKHSSIDANVRTPLSNNVSKDRAEKTDADSVIVIDEEESSTCSGGKIKCEEDGVKADEQKRASACQRVQLLQDENNASKEQSASLPAGGGATKEKYSTMKKSAMSLFKKAPKSVGPSYASRSKGFSITELATDVGSTKHCEQDEDKGKAMETSEKSDTSESGVKGGARKIREGCAAASKNSKGCSDIEALSGKKRVDEEEDGVQDGEREDVHSDGKEGAEFQDQKCLQQQNETIKSVLPATSVPSVYDSMRKSKPSRSAVEEQDKQKGKTSRSSVSVEQKSKAHTIIVLPANIPAVSSQSSPAKQSTAAGQQDEGIWKAHDGGGESAEVTGKRQAVQKRGARKKEKKGAGNTFEWQEQEDCEMEETQSQQDVYTAPSDGSKEADKVNREQENLEPARNSTSKGAGSAIDGPPNSGLEVKEGRESGIDKHVACADAQEAWGSVRSTFTVADIIRSSVLTEQESKEEEEKEKESASDTNESVRNAKENQHKKDVTGSASEEFKPASGEEEEETDIRVTRKRKAEAEETKPISDMPGEEEEEVVVRTTRKRKAKAEAAKGGDKESKVCGHASGAAQGPSVLVSKEIDAAADVEGAERDAAPSTRRKCKARKESNAGATKDYAEIAVEAHEKDDGEEDEMPTRELRVRPKADEKGSGGLVSRSKDAKAAITVGAHIWYQWDEETKYIGVITKPHKCPSKYPGWWWVNWVADKSRSCVRLNESDRASGVWSIANDNVRASGGVVKIKSRK